MEGCRESSSLSNKNLCDQGLWLLLRKRCLQLLLWPHPTTRGRRRHDPMCVCVCVCVQAAEAELFGKWHCGCHTGGSFEWLGNGLCQLVRCPSQRPQVSGGWLTGHTFSCCKEPLEGVTCSPLLTKKLIIVGSACGSSSRRVSDGL